MVVAKNDGAMPSTPFQGFTMESHLSVPSDGHRLAGQTIQLTLLGALNVRRRKTALVSPSPRVRAG